MKRKLIVNHAGLNCTKISARIDVKNFYENDWLFAYEADRKDWYGTGLSAINADPAYQYLHSQNISFYDEKATLSVANIVKPNIIGLSLG